MNNYIKDLEKIAQSFLPDVHIIEKETTAIGVHSIIDENNNLYIIWDKSFWDYFDKTIYLLDTLNYDEDNDEILEYELIKNLIAVIYDHLSKRYKNIKGLSKHLKNTAIRFGYPFVEYFYKNGKDVAIFKEHNNYITTICMLLVLFHEIGHIKLEQDEKLKIRLTQDLTHNIGEYFENIQSVDEFVDTIINSKYTSKHISHKHVKDIVETLNSNQSGNIFEELLCDYFAFAHTFDYLYKIVENAINNVVDIIFDLEDALVLYYTVLRNYAYLSECWSDLPAQYFLSKNMQLLPTKTEMTKVIDMSSILRISFFPNQIICLLIKMGIDYTKKDYSIFNQLNKKEVIYKNIDLFNYIFSIVLEKEFIESVLNESISYSDAEKEFNFFINNQDSTVVASWLSNQYHNNLGISYLNNKNYKSALGEFEKTIKICESINSIGHWHRFTARAYNNAVSALIGLYNESKNIPHLITENPLIIQSLNNFENNPSIYIFYAKKYIDTALDIIEKCNGKEDGQALYVFQNAGSIYYIFRDNSMALRYYFNALSLKNKFINNYSSSTALTDASIALSLFEEGYIEKAEKHCITALNYYRKHENELMNPKDKIECEKIYKMIKKAKTINK